MEQAFFQRQRRSDDKADIVMGKNNIFNKLIVMDGV